MKCIIHFQPLEKYPPVMNFINYLCEIQNQKEFIVLTTFPQNSEKLFTAKSNYIKIFRVKGIDMKDGFLKKIISYFRIYFTWIAILYKKNVSSILYYETLSSFPVFLYKKMNKNLNIFIHYHEYTSLSEYKKQSKFFQFLHNREIILYKKALWISHTNQQRLDMFIKDEHLSKEEDKFKTLPNYPPKSWYSSSFSKVKNSDVIKFVYIGAIGLETMYVKEFSNFILNCNGQATWDIYTNQKNDEAISYISKINTPWIQVKGQIDYFQVKEIIESNNYDIGVILYKGHIPNYVYNAPNKLFEYLACGLQVWYPNVMLGCKEFSMNYMNQIIEFDFENLHMRDIEIYSNYTSTPYPFFYESIYDKLAQKILND